MSIAIDIGICTFRRPQLAATVRSLAQLQLPPAMMFRVIIADNDETPSAKPLVESLARETGLNIAYHHAPARNISVARNACLDHATAPLLAFIDDDEEVTPYWLSALHQRLQTEKADIVLGPVKAIGLEAYAPWVQQGGFFDTQPVWVKGKIITGYSCNVLFERDAPALRGVRFREDLGQSGGEDTAFFASAAHAGARIAYAPEARVTEIIPPHRAHLRWLLQRRFRSGQTHGLLLRESGAFTPLHFLQALTKALFCAGMAVGNSGNGVRARFWLLRGMLHVGTMASLLMLQHITPYGGEHAA